VLVGPNNAGKSSVVEALKLSGVREQPKLGRSVRNETYGDRVSIKYELSDDTQHELRSNNKGTYVTTWDPDGAPLANRVYTVPARRNIEAFFGRGVTDRAGFSGTTSDLPADRNQAPTLTGRLIQIAESPELKKRFDDDVERLLGQELKWELDLAENNSHFFSITSSTGIHTSDGLGFGILSIFYIVAGLFDAEEGAIICVDEPELSMHPQIQRRVAEYLAEHAGRLQVIISTHSPYFVNPEWFQSGAELARCYVHEGSTEISQLTVATRAAISNLARDLNNPHVLGLDAREIFFSEEGVLVVEGQEDVLLLRKITEQLGITIPQTFFGWGAGGAEKVRLVLSILRDLGFKTVSTLLDGDKAATTERLRADFSNYKHYILPADDIRDKPARTTQEKSGVCESNGTLKPAYVDEVKA